MSGMSQKLKGYIDRRKIQRERITDNVEREDFLLSQIDEFREKAKQLQNLISSKEDKVQELQEIVEEKEGQAKELSDIIEERQDAAERVVSGVGEQIDGMVNKVDAKLKELNETFAERLAENAVNSTEQNEAVRKLIDEYQDKMSEAIKGLDGQFEAVKNEICEKVHTEDVKCYRNMQTLIEESDRKIEETKDAVAELVSLKTMVKVTLVFTALNFVGLAAFLIHVLGII
ncbi:hypothetical protein H8S17_04410 [Roseburia sp. BX1005]|uniref:Uncharacterized protein n=1 Tax=Roseburia zhanii TaxID=2763064 RepID=A0A923LMK3_9FIRM|nr:hypothetical protein [Roseburia zhanii]MBC5713463.1 hypothetical protein [Roseburia zhanii]